MSKHQDIVEKFRKTRRSSRPIEAQNIKTNGGIEFDENNTEPLLNGTSSIDQEFEVRHELNDIEGEEVSSLISSDSAFSSDVNLPINGKYIQIFPVARKNEGKFPAESNIIPQLYIVKCNRGKGNDLF